MVDFNKVYLFRMTHIENIPHILKYGITHPESEFANGEYIGIGDQTIIETRKDKILIDDKKILDSKNDFIFTDGHAISSLSTKHKSDEIDNLLEIIDQDAIKSTQWSGENDLDLKRRKEAEFLLLGDLGIDSIVGFVVYDDMAKNKMIDFGVNEKKIAIRKDYYYDKF